MDMPDRKRAGGSVADVLPRIVGAFVAGAFSVVAFHQLAWGLFYVTGVSPVVPYPIRPVPPFGVPRVVSQMFWGGLWGIVLMSLLRTRRGTRYWLLLFAMGFGFIVPSLVGLFVVPLLKGLPPGASQQTGQPEMIIQLVGTFANLAWGFGTALILRLLPPKFEFRA
jgi:hypothetical protein